MKTKLLALALVTAAGIASANPYHHHGHHGGGGGWIAPLIIGGVAGAVIANQSRPQVVVPPPPIYSPPVINTFPPIFQPNCRQELASQFDQYGREYRYPVTICN